MDEFQSTLPLRGATLDLTLASAGVDISIHTPLAGSDRPYTSSPKYSLLFQSTLPLRGATRFGEEGRAERQISIHTPLAGSDRGTAPTPADQFISIHTPLAGSDLAWRAENHRRNISIHTPLAGSDSGQHDLGAVHQISIHTPLAGSDALQRRAPETEMISIHTPLAGSDLVERVPSALILEFQSTLPLRRATIRCPFLARIPPDFNPHSPCGERLIFGGCFGGEQISIHTPLAGSDITPFTCSRIACNFNPHSPCGERHGTGIDGKTTLKFQSTLPLRGATPYRRVCRLA